jgi:hypothetical protein
MAETQQGERRGVNLPVIGRINRNWVIAGGALIVGIVGYAYWNRNRSVPISDEMAEQDIPQDREPPPTVVGAQEYDTGEVRAIINTNPEWYTAAVDYLSSQGGYDFAFVTITLGKFLARRQLTEAEANLIQAAKGAVGEPPQGGPWPIIRATAVTPTTPGKITTTWHGHRLAQNTTWLALARARAKYPHLPNSVEGTRLQMIARNPTITARIGGAKNAVLKKGWIVIVPIHHKAAA